MVSCSSPARAGGGGMNSILVRPPSATYSKTWTRDGVVVSDVISEARDGADEGDGPWILVGVFQLKPEILERVLQHSDYPANVAELHRDDRHLDSVCGC